MRYSLGFVLALSLAGLQFIAILIVVSTSYVTSERAMLAHARGLMDEVGANAAEHTKRFLEPATEITEQARRMLDSGLVSVVDPAALETYFFQLLRTEPQLSGIYYGDETGNFTYVMRDEAGGGADGFRTKLIKIQNDLRRTEYIWRDAQFNIVKESLDPADIFDARTRPWYVSARALDTQGGLAGRSNAQVWTDPYIFYSSQQPGITIAAPIRSDKSALHGVVGIDLDIADISLFLSDLTIGDSGAAFILSDEGKVIAHPDPARISTRNADGTLGFIEIDDFSDPVVRAAFRDFETVRADGLGPVRSEFAFSGESYMTLLLPIPDIDLPWNIAVFAPENDFIQGIKDNRFRNIWIAAFVSVITALVGVTLAEFILKPVRAFAVRTALVSQGEVALGAPQPKTYKELRAANTTLINEIAQRRKLDAKLHDLNRELADVSRVNMLGQMATGLAHELSQPMTAITQNLDTALSIAKKQSDPDEDLIAILGELDEQAHQGGDVIRALRSFVRNTKNTPELFDLKDLISQTQRLLRQELEAAHVVLEVNLPVLEPALGDRVQIAQVLINLLRNAIDAIQMAGHLDGTISIEAKQHPESIEVLVHDSGPGVDEEVRLFKEFQTSKPEGLGLGLSISRRIIENGGGSLTYNYETHQFRFTLPSVSADE